MSDRNELAFSRARSSSTSERIQPRFAVGVYTDPTTSAQETLTLHWNGTNWSKVASPNPGGTGSGNTNTLAGISADSTTDAWAVGFYTGGTLVVHWNGTSWSEA